MCSSDLTRMVAADAKAMDTDAAPAASAAAPAPAAPTAQHGVDEVPQDWKLVVADKVRMERAPLFSMRARTPPVSLTPSLPSGHLLQRFAYRLASDPAVKAGLQADIVAAYKEHGKREESGE